MALQKPISILTGPPGSGKTTALKELALQFKSTEVVLLAPTGKAVVRLKEVVTGGYTQPMTVHRWLSTTAAMKKKPRCSLVIVDESSMLDIFTFEALLDTMTLMMDDDHPPHLVLVGDTDQLPSVGPGNVLRDMILAGLPHVQLNNVYRQEQGSQLACAIQALREDPMAIMNFTSGSDFWMETITNKISLSARLRSLIKQYSAADGSGVMVATFMNKNVQFFADQLNPPKRLPRNAKEWKMLLAVGDRVMQSHNVYTESSQRLNGETGTVTRIEPTGSDDRERIVAVVFDTDKRTELYKDNKFGTQETYEELSMAMPITVHKAQGSQAETVIYVIPDESMYETRNLVYTAISRAEKRCVVLGNKKAFIVAINRPTEERRTMLADFLFYDDSGF
jgi:exodeoxyribonuclease V alpha subunit